MFPRATTRGNPVKIRFPTIEVRSVTSLRFQLQTNKKIKKRFKKILRHYIFYKIFVIISSMNHLHVTRHVFVSLAVTYGYAPKLRIHFSSSDFNNSTISYEINVLFFKVVYLALLTFFHIFQKPQGEEIIQVLRFNEQVCDKKLFLIKMALIGIGVIH